jgi:hypothetical protein
MVGHRLLKVTVGRSRTAHTAKPYRLVKDLPTVERGGLP